MRKKTGPCAWECALVALCLLSCLAGAWLLPIEKCPDEGGRRFVSDWIYRTGTLPTGSEWQTQIMYWEDASAPVGTIMPGVNVDGWGFSYALRPYLASLLAALFMRAAALFTEAPRVLLLASRLGSVLSITLCCVFCLRLGRRLFERRASALLFAAFVCFLPQVQFLGMYQNCDALALCAVSLTLYSFCECCERGWPVKSCVALAVGFSLGLLSYYSIYGWLLMGAVFCVLAVLTDPGLSARGRLLLRRAALVVGLCLLFTLWHFVRNALLHEGDFLGLASEARSRAVMRAQGYRLYEYTRLRDEGFSLAAFLGRNRFHFLRLTVLSFIGVFGYLDIFLPYWLYGAYGAVFVLGVLLYLRSLRCKPARNELLLTLWLVSASVITLALHVWQSYTRDYQPQGRYIITLSLLLAFLTARGADRLKGRCGGFGAAALTVCWLGLCALSFILAF